jgi:hypothetical protein
VIFVKKYLDKNNHKNQGKPAHCRMRILNDSARKRNMKEVLANIIKQEVT